MAAVNADRDRHRQGSHEALSEAVNNTGRAEISRFGTASGFVAITCRLPRCWAPAVHAAGVIRICSTLERAGTGCAKHDLTAGRCSAVATVADCWWPCLPCDVHDVDGAHRAHVLAWRPAPRKSWPISQAGPTML